MGIVRRSAALASGLALSMLAACGGGGGGGGSAGADAGSSVVTTVTPATLAQDMSYQGNLDLLHPSTLTPLFTGIDASRATCSLVAGAVPEGMTMRSDCVISGTPTRIGLAQPRIRVSSALVDFVFDFLISGPSTAYAYPTALSGGSAVNLLPTPNDWSAQPDDVVTYSVVGALPPGLVLDPTTGRISGAPTQDGQYFFRVEARVDHAGLSVTTPPGPGAVITVARPQFTYDNTTMYAGVPYVGTPSLAAAGGSWQYSATASLPPGLVLNPTTGVVSGTPTRLGGGSTTFINAVAVGSSYTVVGGIFQPVLAPLSIHYPYLSATVGQPFSNAPVVSNDSGADLSGMTLSYALAAGQTLPAGVTLDPSTGVISGTSSTLSIANRPIELTVTLNGATFLVGADSNIFLHY